MPLRNCSFKLVLIGALVALATGCLDAKSRGPAKRCTKAYEQCALAEGLLGVCDPVECQAGQAAPCFICRPQH